MAPLVEVEELKMWFPIKSGLVLDRHVGDVKAVDGVSFTIERGETLGLVGGSGGGETGGRGGARRGAGGRGWGADGRARPGAAPPSRPAAGRGRSLPARVLRRPAPAD